MVYISRYNKYLGYDSFFNRTVKFDYNYTPHFVDCYRSDGCAMFVVSIRGFVEFNVEFGNGTTLSWYIHELKLMELVGGGSIINNSVFRRSTYSKFRFILKFNNDFSFLLKLHENNRFSIDNKYIHVRTTIPRALRRCMYYSIIRLTDVRLLITRFIDDLYKFQNINLYITSELSNIRLFKVVGVNRFYYTSYYNEYNYFLLYKYTQFYVVYYPYNILERLYFNILYYIGDIVL